MNYIELGSSASPEQFESFVRAYCRKIIQSNLQEGISEYGFAHNFTFYISPNKAYWAVTLEKAKHSETAKGDSLSHVNAECVRRLDFAAAPKLALSFEPMQSV